MVLSTINLIMPILSVFKAVVRMIYTLWSDPNGQEKDEKRKDGNKN